MIASALSLDALNIHLKSKMLKTNLVVDTKYSGNFELFTNASPTHKPSHTEKDEFCVLSFNVIMAGKRQDQRQGSRQR